MLRYLTFFVEEVFYRPKLYHLPYILLTLPLSFIYFLVVFFKRYRCVPKEMGIKVISVGNLSVGGSGKSPFVIELARRYPNSAVILRGYRQEIAQDLLVVSNFGKIAVDVEHSGDEAQMIARQTHATVITAKDRRKAIAYAKQMGAKVVILDDAFHHCNISKFDILLYPQSVKNPLLLPSGGFREPLFFKKFASIVVQEGSEFVRHVRLKNSTQKMALITAIANPKRLERYLDEAIPKFYFEDHHNFTQEEVDEIMQKGAFSSIVCTQKDAVKLERFGYPLCELALSLEIEPRVFSRIDAFLNQVP